MRHSCAICIKKSRSAHPALPLCLACGKGDLGHSARKSRKSRKSHKSHSCQLSSKSRKSGKCRQPGTVFTYISAGRHRRFLLLRMFVREFFGSFFLFAMHDTRTVFFFVCSLFAERSIFSLRFSPHQSMPLPYESNAVFFVNSGRTSNFKTQRPRNVFPETVHNRLTLQEGDTISGL